MTYYVTLHGIARVTERIAGEGGGIVGREHQEYKKWGGEDK